MVVLIRCNSILSDSRVEKYIRFYNDQKIDHKVLGWDRLSEGISGSNIEYYSLRSSYNQGGVRAVYHRIKWMFFVYNYLRKNSKRILTVHACDLDAAFPSVLYNFLNFKKMKVIFDIFDWYTSNFHNKNRLILLVFNLMERFTIRYADEYIICEPERIEQIPYKLSKKELVLPNIPSFSDYSFLELVDKYKFNDDKIVVSYVGGFSAERFLDELLDIAERGLVNLLIAGYGDVRLEKKCEMLNSLPNIKYFSKVDYKLGLNIMYNSDLIYAMYCKSNPNHLYAAPNKYYEAMLLKKPILSTNGISISKKICNENTGFVINESLKELEKLVLSLSREDMIVKGENAGLLWQMKFYNYTSVFLNTVYKDIIKK